MMKNTSKQGTSPGRLPSEDQANVLRVIQQKCDEAPQERRQIYQKNLNNFQMNFTRPDGLQKILTYDSLPELAQCVDMSCVELFDRLGCKLCWPSEDLRLAYEALSVLSPRQVLRAKDLAQRIAPTYWRDKYSNSPTRRSASILKSIPLRDHQSVLRDLQRLYEEKTSRPFADSDLDKLWRNLAPLVSPHTIVVMSSYLDISPIWFLGWMDRPILAATADMEQVMVMYSFLSKTYRQAFVQFLRNISTIEFDGELAPRSYSWNMPKGEPVVVDADQLKTYQTFWSEYSKLREMTHTDKGRLRTEEAEAGKANENTKTADTAQREVIRAFSSAMFSKVRQDSFWLGGEAANSVANLSRLTGYKKDYCCHMRTRKTALPVQFIKNFCYNVHHISVHELYTGERVPVMLPRALAATAEMLDNQFSDAARANLLTWSKKMAVAEWRGGETEPTEENNPFYSDGLTQDIFMLIMERCMEIAEERYSMRAYLFRGHDVQPWKGKLITHNTLTNPNAKRPAVKLHPMLLMCFSILDMPADFFVERDYLRFLPAAYKRSDGAEVEAKVVTGKIISQLLLSIPEFRSFLLSKIWTAAYTT